MANDSILPLHHPVTMNSPSRQELIAKPLWDLATFNRITRFNAFFDHYQDQVNEQTLRTGDSTNILAVDGLFIIVRTIKQSSHIPKAEFREALDLAARRVLATRDIRRSYGTVADLEDVPGRDQGAELALATIIRIMFAINLSTSPGRMEPASAANCRQMGSSVPVFNEKGSWRL